MAEAASEWLARQKNSSKKHCVSCSFLSSYGLTCGGRDEHHQDGSREACDHL